MKQITMLLTFMLLMTESAFAEMPEASRIANNSWAGEFEHKILASHWQAGQQSRYSPDRLFVIICDAGDTVTTIRNLRELERLKASYQQDPEAWNNEGSPYACISNNSFRLNRPAGIYPHAKDDEEVTDVAFQVVQQSADEQTVEVRYGQGADVVDSLFRYRVRNGKIVPLESWVITRGEFSVAIGIAIALVILLAGLSFVYVLIRALFRWFKAFRARSTENPGKP